MKKPKSPPAEPRHVQSPTAIAAEALSTGVRPPDVVPEQEDNLPREGHLQNTDVGDEAPGGDMPTPDQDLVDEIGRAYGVTEADSGALRSSAELLDERDRRRAELEAPRPPHGTRDADRERTR
jgi:Family of unknown function (DUF6335)